MAVAHPDPQSYKNLRTGWGGRAYFLLPPVAIANPQINKLTGQRPQMGIPKFPGLAAALGLFQFLLWPIKINPNRPASLQPDPHLRLASGSFPACLLRQGRSDRSWNVYVGSNPLPMPELLAWNCRKKYSTTSLVSVDFRLDMDKFKREYEWIW